LPDLSLLFREGVGGQPCLKLHQVFPGRFNGTWQEAVADKAQYQSQGMGHPRAWPLGGFIACIDIQCTQGLLVSGRME
jgi:hypothetical protein